MLGGCMRHHRVRWIFFGMIAVLASGCGAQNERPLAKVGSRFILIRDFESALANLPANYKVLTESAKGKRKILDNLVKKELLLLEAERRGIQKQSAIREEVAKAVKENRQELERQMADIRARLKRVEQQSYENIILRELNNQLRSNPPENITHSPEDIAAYYEDYVRKLKIVNPAVVVPALTAVESQIRAILTEEKLLQKLEKECKVEVKEKLFTEKFGDEPGQVIIEEELKK